jgi:hypothetical protein
VERLRYHLVKESPMFRISLLLWLIALAAVNLTVLKYSEPLIELSTKFAGLIGLMPLFDLFALSLYLALTARFRFALVRRQVRGSLVGSTAAWSGTILALGTLASLLFPEVVLQMLDVLYRPVDQWIGVSSSSPETRGFLILPTRPAVAAFRPRIELPSGENRVSTHGARHAGGRIQAVQVQDRQQIGSEERMEPILARIAGYANARSALRFAWTRCRYETPRDLVRVQLRRPID